MNESAEDNALMRKVASESIVLLKNEGSLLPLQASALKKIAIIGPNAKARVRSGGGSGNLRASYVITPYEGIVKALPRGTEVLYNAAITSKRYLNDEEYEGIILFFQLTEPYQPLTMSWSRNLINRVGYSHGTIWPLTATLFCRSLSKARLLMRLPFISRTPNDLSGSMKLGDSACAASFGHGSNMSNSSSSV